MILANEAKTKVETFMICISILKLEISWYMSPRRCQCEQNFVEIGRHRAKFCNKEMSWTRICLEEDISGQNLAQNILQFNVNWRLFPAKFRPPTSTHSLILIIKVYSQPDSSTTEIYSFSFQVNTLSMMMLYVIFFTTLSSFQKDSKLWISCLYNRPWESIYTSKRM